MCPPYLLTRVCGERRADLDCTASPRSGLPESPFSRIRNMLGHPRDRRADITVLRGEVDRWLPTLQRLTLEAITIFFECLGRRRYGGRRTGVN